MDKEAIGLPGVKQLFMCVWSATVRNNFVNSSLGLSTLLTFIQLVYNIYRSTEKDCLLRNLYCTFANVTFVFYLCLHNHLT